MKFEKGYQAVLREKAIDDPTKYVTVVDVKMIDGREHCLVARLSASYFDWVDAEKLEEPGEILLNGCEEFNKHTQEQRHLRLEAELLKQESDFIGELEQYERTTKKKD